MLEIWGRPYSSNVIPVIWTANELGLDYRLQLAGGSFGKLDTEEYAQINPNRMIPAIRDGDFALWESLAIVRYLSDRYGAGTLSPRDPQARAIADQWMEWSASKAFGPVIYLFFATVRTEPSERDPEKIVRLRDEAHEALTILDGHLADRDYVCGNEFTMGDIPLGPQIHRWMMLVEEILARSVTSEPTACALSCSQGFDPTCVNKALIVSGLLPFLKGLRVRLEEGGIPADARSSSLACASC